MTVRLSVLSMLRMAGVVPPLPITPSWRAGGNFTFVFHIQLDYVINKGCLLIAEPIQSRPIAGCLQRDCST